MKKQIYTAPACATLSLEPLSMLLASLNIAKGSDGTATENISDAEEILSNEMEGWQSSNWDVLDE